jgi:hypothetical protein
MTMSTKTRLRDQPATLRPRVVIRGKKYWTEYYGPLVEGVCGRQSVSFEDAIHYANQIARRHAPRLKQPKP